MQEDNTQQTQDQHTQEQQEQQQQQQQQNTHQQAQTEAAEMNFRQLRKEKEERDRQLEEYKRRLEQLEQQQNQQKQQQQQQEPSVDDISDNDLVEGRHLKKKMREIENELNQYKQQASTTAAETRLKQEMPDIDQVVNEKTISRLREQYPELAQTLGSTSDLYTQGKATYRLVKQLGLAETAQQQEDKQNVQENAQSPRPAQQQQQDDQPLNQANAYARGMSEDIRRKRYQEMLEAAKGRN